MFKTTVDSGVYHLRHFNQSSIGPQVRNDTNTFATTKYSRGNVLRVFFAIAHGDRLQQISHREHCGQ